MSAFSDSKPHFSPFNVPFKQPGSQTPPLKIPLNDNPSQLTPERDDKSKNYSESSSSTPDSQDSNKNGEKERNNLSVSPKKSAAILPEPPLDRPLRGSIAPARTQYLLDAPQRVLRPSKSSLMEKDTLATPDFLKEYRYRRRSSRSIINDNVGNEMKEVQQMVQIPFLKKTTRSSISSQGGLSPSPKVGAQFDARKIMNENKLMLDQKQMSESQGNQGSYFSSDSSDEEPEISPRRKALRNKLRVGLRVAYFLGILFSMKNRVKIYGALRSEDHMKKYEVKKEEEKKRRFFLPLLPTDTFTIVWTIILIFLLILTALLTPYRVSFVDDSDHTFKIIDLMFDVGFGFDMLVNFVRAYHDPTHGLVTNLRTIVINYVKAWFWIDLVAILPFDNIIDALTAGQSSTIRLNKLLRLLRFPRLYRLLKILRIFKMVNIFSVNQTLNRAIKKLNLNIGIIRIFKVLINILFLNHIVGCIWFLAARMADFDPDTWVVRCGLLNKSSWDQYVASYYWAFQTLTTVGFGDIAPKTFFERIIAIVWMVVGVGFYSFTIGNLSTILANIDRKSAILKTKLTTFNSFAIKIKLPEYLRQKVQRFFEYRINTTLRSKDLRLNHKENVYYWMDPQEILKELPANLKTSLLLYSYYGMIKNIRLLQLDANFTASILTQLKLLKLKKAETLYREGDPAEEVYFISKGSIKFVNDMGQSIYALTEGTYFGEAETLADEKRMSFCQATESTILLVCERASFLESLKDFPTIEMQIKRTLQTRKAKYDEKVALLREMAISKAENEESDSYQQTRKLMNSTEYFNKVVVKNFSKEKKSPTNGADKVSRRKTGKIVPQGPKTVTVTPAPPAEKITPNPPTNVKKESGSDSTRFKPPLEIVSEERHSPLSPKLLSENLKEDKDKSLTSFSMKDDKTSLSFSVRGSRSRLLGLCSPKDEERGLLDDGKDQKSPRRLNEEEAFYDHTERAKTNGPDSNPISVWRRQAEPEFPSLLFSKSKKISQRDLRSQGSFKDKAQLEDNNEAPVPKTKWFLSANATAEKLAIKEVPSEDRKDEEQVKEDEKVVRDEEEQEVDEKGRNNEMEDASSSEEETHSESTPRTSEVNNQNSWLNREDRNLSNNNVKTIVEDVDPLYCSIKTVEFAMKKESPLVSGRKKSTEVKKDGVIEEVKLKSTRNDSKSQKEVCKIKLDNLISMIKDEESDDENNSPGSRDYQLEGEEESDIEDIFRDDF